MTGKHIVQYQNVASLPGDKHSFLAYNFAHMLKRSHLQGRAVTVVNIQPELFFAHC